MAAHQAHTGLLARETVAALAGGVNAMLLPITTTSISALSALSPVARCKTFDASAGVCRGGAALPLCLAAMGGRFLPSLFPQMPCPCACIVACLPSSSRSLTLACPWVVHMAADGYGRGEGFAALVLTRHDG